MSAEVRLKARHPGCSFLVQAPAGSGKTELLTQRILALLAIVDEPEEILALTFTRKAAAEMRKRVLQSLSAPKPGSDESQAHKMDTWKLAQEAMRRSDERGWHIHRHPARLRIMTLDSLSHSLARSVPLLAGLGEMPSPSEHVKQTYRDAAEAALNEAMRDFSSAAECVLLHQDHNAVSVIGLLADMLAKREQWLQDIAAHSRDLEGLRQRLEMNLAVIMQQKMMDCAALLPVQLQAELPALMRFSGGQRGDEALHQFTAWPEASIDSLAEWQLVANFLLTGTSASFRKPGGVNVRLGFPSKGFAEEKDQFKQLLDILAGQTALAEALHELRHLPETSRIDDQQWQVLKALFLLLVLASKHLQLQFDKQGEADFTEISLRAMDALGAHDEVPGELLMQLDYRIHHILIDEFQDTSHLQMRLLQCLTAGWQECDGRDRSLFMVGDPMQSIYRFRKAEVGLFLNAASNEAGLPSVEALQLQRNFRSSPAIVEWVNQAFNAIFPTQADVISGAVCHAPAEAALSHAGSVHVHLQQGSDAALEAEYVVGLVANALAQGHGLGATKPHRIGILARSRKHLHAIMPALQAAGIAFRAIKILPLNSRPEIRLLRALLRALLHPADRLSWAALLRAPCCGLESYDLHVLLADHTRLVWQAIADEDVFQQLSIDAQSRIAFMRQALTPCLQSSAKVSVRDLLHTAWRRLAMPGLIDATASLNVDAALALVESLDEGGRIDFALLDSGLEKLYAEADASEAAGQVELLTMHGAKGLQWDTVILPGLGHRGASGDTPLLAFSEVSIAGDAVALMAAKASIRQKDSFYDLVNNVEKSKDNNELRRLLYVACTRAETTLHMLGHVAEKDGKAASGSLLQLLLAADANALHGQGCFGAQLNAMEAVEDRVVTSQSGLQRMLSPSDAATLLSSEHQDETEPEMAVETEYVWAGVEAAPVGNTLHAALQHVATCGVENWTDADNQALLQSMRRMLIAEGLSGTLLQTATHRCADGLKRVLGSQRGRWILSGHHQQAHCEWALSLESDHHVSHHIMDRSFIAEGQNDASDPGRADEQGWVRWIIDYKTASHEGSDLEAFLQDEEKRHAPQLRRYAAVLNQLEPHRVVKTALYFPMLDAWVECQN